MGEKCDADLKTMNGRGGNWHKALHNTISRTACLENTVGTSDC